MLYNPSAVYSNLDNNNSLRSHIDRDVDRNIKVSSNVMSVNEINELINSSNLTELAGTESIFEHTND
ncbi:MAG: hypothetical protein ACK521_11665 [bacterium]